MALLKVSKIPRLNTLVIKQDKERAFFIASPTSIVIGIDNLASLLKFLVDNDYLDQEVLEGILEEYNTSKGGIYGTSI